MKLMLVTVARRCYANNCQLGNGPYVIEEPNINFSKENKYQMIHSDIRVTYNMTYLLHHNSISVNCSFVI